MKCGQCERSYFDILTEMKRNVMVDCIPYQEKRIIEDQIDTLLSLLWKYSKWGNSWKKNMVFESVIR